MKKLTSGVLLMFGVCLAQQSLAGGDSGFYWGGSMGQASMTSSSFNTDIADDIDENSSGYKIIFGYNFGWIPTMDFAIEADYRDFGTFDNDTESADLSSYDVYGLLGVNFGPVGLFGKLGFSNTDLEATGDSDFSDSDSSNSYGLGAKIGLGSIAVRAEYEVFDLEGFDDITMSSLGLTVTF